MKVSVSSGFSAGQPLNSVTQIFRAAFISSKLTKSAGNFPGRLGLFFSAVAVLLLVFFAAHLQAQTNRPLPEISFPGAAAPGNLGRAQESLPEPKSKDEIIIPSPEHKKIPPKSDKHLFTLSRVEISGGTVFSVEVLESHYQEYLGKKINVGVMFDVANTITKRYADEGYALSMAYLPAQKIDSEGIVRINLIEGYIGVVDYRGDVHALSQRTRTLLEELTGMRPLRSDDLERQLLLARDVSGLEVKTILDRANFDAGAAKLIVELKHTQAKWSVGLNNRGSEAQGPIRANIGGKWFFPSFAESTLGLRYQQAESADEYSYWRFHYSLGISQWDTRLELEGAVSESSPDTALLNAFEFLSESQQVTLGLSQPFIRTRRKNFSGYLKLDAKDSESFFAGDPNSEDKTRVLRIGTQYDWIDNTGSTNLINVEISKGLDLLGATDQDYEFKARAIADYEFSALKLTLSRHQRFASSASLFMSLQAQYSSDPLASSEQCGWGGELFGRAYDDFEASGDSCILASVELRNTFMREGAGSRYVQSYAFLDAGSLELNDVDNVLESAGINVEIGDNVRYSAGLGVRSQFEEDQFFSVEVAVPLHDPVALESSNQKSNKEPRVFASWRMSF